MKTKNLLKKIFPIFCMGSSNKLEKHKKQRFDSKSEHDSITGRETLQQGNDNKIKNDETTNTECLQDKININETVHPKRLDVNKIQMKEFREAFRLIDNDGDGSITKEELSRFMRSLGQYASTEELQQVLQEIDVDGDGNVNFEEFVTIASLAPGAGNVDSILLQEQEEKELRDAFRVFDKRDRGYIGAADLKAVLQSLGVDLTEEEIEVMIKEVDVDGDGRIDFYEFVNALDEPITNYSYDEDGDDVSIN